jgi:hypothetical protein
MFINFVSGISVNVVRENRNDPDLVGTGISKEMVG